MHLFGEPLDRKKALVSLILGLAGFVAAFFSFSVLFPPHTISITWNLFLPMLAALAYGWRYALVAVTLGGMGFFSFALWPTNGWANLVNVVIYGSWFVIHGYAADRRRARPSAWNNGYLVQVLCSAFYSVLLLAVFPRLFTLNPPFWYSAAPAFIPVAVAKGIAVKQAFMMFCTLFLCDLLLQLPSVPRWLGLPVPSSARFTLRTTALSLLIGLAAMITYLVLEAVFAQSAFDDAVQKAVTTEHFRFVYLIVFLSMVAGLQLAKYLGRRHDAEEALRVSDERFRAIFESVNDAILLLDPSTGAIVDANRTMSGMFGYSRDEASKISLGEISSGEAPYTAVDAIAWVRRAVLGRAQTFEWHCRHQDGHLFWSEVTMRLGLIGGADRVLVMVRDITRKKKVEEKLQESERLYRMLFDSAGDAIFLLEEARIVDCNNKSLDMFGCSWEQLLGSTPVRFSPPTQPDGRNSQEKILEKITAALAGNPQNYEWKYVRADGTPFDAEVSLGRIELSFGVRLQAIVRDITGRKQAEESLRDLVAKVSRSQKEWQDTFDSITDMISIHDKDFNVVRANKAFFGFLGLSPREVINKKCYDLMHHGALSPISGCPHQRTLREKMPVTEEVFDEKTRKTFRVATYPYYSPSGEIIGSIHIAREITGEKEREMGLIMTERLASLGQMASGIAHEINNPLESVMICAEMLLMKVSQDKYDHAQFEKYLKIIDEEVLRCRDITGSMLSFSRQTAAEKQDIDIHLLLDKAIDLVGYQGRLRNVQVIKRYGEHLRVRGNEGELRQVFLVLVINALDAMVNKGALTVETGAQESGIWVRISDTGPGIPPENIQKIFQPFFTTKIDTGGTGLGLSIAHRIIANHQGTIGISSEPGQGAAFTVTLPV